MFKNKLSLLMGTSAVLFSTGLFAETSRHSDEASKPRVEGQRSEESRARMGEEAKEHRRERAQLVKESSDVYRALVKNESNKIPQNVLARAKCIAVFPNVVTAALVVGGSHGEGLVSCNNSGKWSPPAYVDLTGGSIGAQVGGKQTDLVLFISSEKAIDALKKGKFELGADASVVAGSFDRTVETDSSGVVAYQRTEGAFLGASLNGVSINRDMDGIRAQYGNDVDYVALLEGRAAATAGTNESELMRLFPSTL